VDRVLFDFDIGQFGNQSNINITQETFNRLYVPMAKISGK